MCGIFFYQKKNGEFSKDEIQALLLCFNRIKHRGPDESNYFIVKNKFFIGFHRLAINGLENGSQPFIYKKENGSKTYVMCNGEIYNHEHLKKKYELDYENDSDCAVLYPLYCKIGIENLCKEIDGVFAMVMFDEDNENIVIARDMIGIRPLFIGNNDNCLALASEAKAIHDLVTCQQFSPGAYFDKNDEYPLNYFIKLRDIQSTNFTESDKDIHKNIRDLFYKSIEKRMMSDRSIGCLLSGGLDSSLVAAILQKMLDKDGKKLNTYAIGMEGATDIINARKVAEFIGSNHHEHIISEGDALGAINSTIETIESYDTTTIRASVGMYLISKYIKEQKQDIVIFSGEGSDELFEGYIYFHYAPNEMEGRLDSLKLLEQLHMFDVLRADRTISMFGLEARVPFLDKALVKYILSLSPKKIIPTKGVEKYILRKAFENENLLPSEIIWRTKEAFSDGVSSKEKSWHHTIQEMIDKNMDEETKYYLKKMFFFNKPRTKEEIMYRSLFIKYYPEGSEWISNFWQPKWINKIDPSARELSIYSKLKKENNKNLKKTIQKEQDQELEEQMRREFEESLEYHIEEPSNETIEYKVDKTI